MERSHLKVLFVDDDPDDRFLTKRALLEDYPGLVTRDVLDERDFEAALAEGPYDLAVTDCSLGWSDGFSVAERVKRAFPGCPVVMFTGSELVTGEMVSRAVRAPVFDFIRKTATDFGAFRAAVRRSQSEARTAPEPRAPSQPPSARPAPPQDVLAFSAAARAIPDYAVFLLDGEGRVSTWNAGAEKTQGFSAEEIVGRPFDALFTPEDRAMARPRVLLEKARDSGHAEDAGWRLRKGGGRIWAEVSLTALAAPGGKITGFCVICRDTSERKYADEELRRSEQRFRALIKGVQDYAIYMLDVEGRVMSWNTGAERLKGYLTDEVLGKHLSIFFPLEEKDRAAGLLARAAERGTAHDEGWRLRKDGTRFWADATITALRDDEGRLTGFAKVTRDLTERKRLEAELEERAKMLARMNQELELFSGTVSHDLKAPLRQIAGFATLLKRRPDGPDAKEFLDRIIDGAARLQGMISDLLQYSMAARLGPGETVELAAVVDRVAARFDPEAREKGGKVAVAGPIPAVCAQESVVERMVENLVGNAVKYGAADVEVRAEDREKLVRLLVQDRGAGVPERLRPRLFEPFVRGHGSEAASGHGLGLAIVRRAAERFGGGAGYAPREGGGSVFFIDLPKA